MLTETRELFSSFIQHMSISRGSSPTHTYHIGETRQRHLWGLMTADREAENHRVHPEASVVCDGMMQ